MKLSSIPAHEQYPRFRIDGWNCRVERGARFLLAKKSGRQELGGKPPDAHWFAAQLGAIVTAGTLVVSIAQLRRWCGAPDPRHVAIEQCRWGTVLGVPVNRSLLAYALTVAPKRGSIRIRRRIALPGSSHYDRAIVVCDINDEWRIILMGATKSVQAKGLSEFKPARTA